MTGGNLACSATSLAVQSNTTINVQLTGLVEGGQSYSVNVSSGETDRNTGNNSVQGQVTVGEPEADSGSGAFGLLEMMALLLLLLARLGARLKVCPPR